MKNNTNIERQIKEKLENFSPQVPKHVADKIKAKGRAKAKSIRLKKLIINISVVVSVATFGIVGFHLLTEEKEIITNSEVVMNSTITESIPDEPLELNIPIAVETLDNWENPRISIPKSELEEDEKEEITFEEDDGVRKEKEVESEKISPQVIKKEDKKVNRNVMLPQFPNTELGRAQYEAAKLKNGVLLVRLKTKINAIKYYEKKGDFERVDAIKKSVLRENKRLMNLFKDNFDFCEVQFFYSTDSDSIRKKITKGYLLNDDLKIDNTISIDDKYFIVAETGSGDMLSRMIILRDHNFEYLTSPFPYYQRATRYKNDAKNIRKLSAKLHNFLNQ